MHLRSAVLALIVVLFSSGVHAGEVPWLNDVATPPADFPTDKAGPMQPLFPDGAPATAKNWAKRRADLLAAWEKKLGPMPDRPKSGFTELKTEDLGKIRRIRIRYENEPGQMIEAYLLKPVSESAQSVRSRAGLVALHQTTKNTIDEIAGVTDPASPQAIALRLAERGFVVICPRNFLWEEATTLPGAVEAFRSRHPNTLGMKKMLYDAQRATDLLTAVPEVDPARIGAVGHSLGSKEALYLAAFDERIRAAVASEGGITFASTNWEAPWYLGPGVRDANFERNHHELLALTAPRALLILGGETGPGAADGARSWPLIAAAQPVYRALGTPVRLGLLNHGQGHSIPPDVFEKLSQWLDVYTQPADKEVK